MKRKVLIVFLIICLFVAIFCNCNKKETQDDIKKQQTTNIDSQNKVTDDNIKAVWINYYELSMKSENGGTKESFTSKIDTMFKQAKNLGLNTVIVQVRPFSDSFYDSNIFPYSKYITGIQGKSPGYDPLEIMCNYAKKYNLQIHAWINPYRVLYENDFEQLDEKNPAKIWKEDGLIENDSWIIETSSGIFYNPSVPQVQKMLIDGVREIIEKYPINAIHMDDYFYPSTDENIDKIEYTAYLSNGGTRSLADWRRDNVNTFVSGLYSAIKSTNRDIKLCISPTGDIAENYDTHYADVKEWVSNTGYIDYIIPQLYYGFENQSKPFKEIATQWSNLMEGSNAKIFYGLALYKCGDIDEYAGNGKCEWQNYNDVISRQIAYLKELPHYNGIALYSYQHILSKDIEVQSLKKLL